MTSQERAVLARLGFGVRSAGGRPVTPSAVHDPSSLLRGSRLPLAAIEAISDPDLRWLREDGGFRALHCRHLERRQAYEAEFRSFAVEAARAGLPVIVLKAGGVFPYESSNLDLLVPPDRMRQAADILASLGFLDLRHYNEPHKTLHKKMKGGRELAIFHLHEQVSWDGAVFLDPDDLWSRRIVLEGFPSASRLAPADLAALTIAHGVHENGRLRVADLRRMLHALDEDGALVGRVEAAAHRFGWTPGLRIGAGALARIEQDLLGTSRVASSFGIPSSRGILSREGVNLGRTRARLLLAAKILRCPAAARGARLRLLARFVSAKTLAASRWPRQRSVLVALSGVDGAGKSYYAERIDGFLGECDLVTARIWARGGSTRPILWIKSAVRGLLPARHGAVAVHAEGAPLARGWQRRSWPWLVALELLITYGMRVLPRLLLHRVVLCDRHILDATVDMAVRLRGEDPRARLPWRILSALAPVPHLHFLFTVSADVALRRKDLGMDRARVDDRRALYRRFAGAAVQIIDTERDPDTVVDEVASRIVVAAGPLS